MRIATIADLDAAVATVKEAVDTGDGFTLTFSVTPTAEHPEDPDDKRQLELLERATWHALKGLGADIRQVDHRFLLKNHGNSVKRRY